MSISGITNIALTGMRAQTTRMGAIADKRRKQQYARLRKADYQPHFD
ncbi:hypothetical protein GA0061105_101383 [Rhizobium aethiopicum]|uniref:Uncharacterized protein n=1 Tax=Rhizobium aethiopicum TaxID=1138170 RepID=A0A1C3XWW6_9HYPH|nr:hypothetical protein GA0061105_101383 [Rhizobium aethiopicum]